MHITIETSSKTGQSCTLNGSGHIHRLTTYQNHRGPAWGKCRSFTLQRPLKANDAAFKIGTSPRRQIEEHPLRSNSSVEAAYVTRTNHGQWPSVRHKWSSPSSSSCLPNLINKTWPRWHSRWHLAVAVFVIDCSLLMLPNHVGAAKGLPDRIPVGAIFLKEGETELRAAFEHAIEVHNYRDSHFSVAPHVELVESDDPFQVAKKICSILKNGTFAMVATTTASSYETLVSYSNTFQIPIVSPSFPYHTRLRPARYGISMRPDYLKAILDLIQHYRWKQIVYIYDSDAGLLKLQNLYKLTTDEYKLEIIKVRRVTSASEANKFLVNYDNETRDQLKHVVIDCEANLTREIIIKHVKHPIVGRRTFHFLLGGLIMDEFANNPAIEFGAVNITGFRLVQNNSRAYEEVFTEKSRHQWPDPKTKTITASTYNTMFQFYCGYR